MNAADAAKKWRLPCTHECTHRISCRFLKIMLGMLADLQDEKSAAICTASPHGGSTMAAALPFLFFSPDQGKTKGPAMKVACCCF